MKLRSLEVIVGVFLQLGVTLGGSWKRSAFLDSEEKFHVSWKVEEKIGRVTFEVSVQTNGFVGFGVTFGGGMKGADVVIGGVTSRGSHYFTDRHAVGNLEPKVDSHEDWKLLEASENSTHTFLKFSRLLETCDSQDVPITRDAQKFIWSFGDSNDIAYHLGNRGSYSLNILDPPVILPDTSKWDRLELVVKVKMPPKETTYWCTLFKSPKFQEKRQAIGFGAILKSPLAKKHSHHLSLTVCEAPEDVEDVDKFFDQFVKVGGEDCFGSDFKRSLPVYSFCSGRILYSWAMGAREMFLPEDVGLSLTGGQRVYFLLEVHLDNPGAKRDISFETGTVIFHTDSLRQIEGGIFSVESPADYSLMVPPNSTEFVVSTHCTPSCTNHLGTEGISVFNVQFHAHRSAVKMKLRHFRNSVELPWISSDENYDNSFQSNRNLKPVRILPGDQLTLECSYTTTWSPKNAVIGGYSTSEEMCDATMYYFPKGPVSGCGSKSTSFLRSLGIRGLSTDPKDPDNNPGISRPKKLRGIRYREFLDEKVSWSPKLREEVQKKMRFDPQEAFCRREQSELEILEELEELWRSSPPPPPPETVEYPSGTKAFVPLQPTC